MKMSSASLVTVYDFKSFIFAGKAASFPLVQSNFAPCHPQVIVEPSSVPSAKLAPACVHVSSHAK